MARKRSRKPSRRSGRKSSDADSRDYQEALSIHADYLRLKRKVESLWDIAERTEERLQDIEVHVNLLTRLITTICVEKLKMRVGVLKRLIKRIEKEAIRDSQIHHLESLYKLPMKTDKKAQPPAKNDPWDEIS